MSQIRSPWVILTQPTKRGETVQRKDGGYWRHLERECGSTALRFHAFTLGVDEFSVSQRYPGAACDIPFTFYSFSVSPRVRHQLQGKDL